MFDNLTGKRILLGITGGIAAYKVLELIRRLREHGAQVKVILTQAAKEFVTPLSIQALAGEKPYGTLLSIENEAAMSHIELARWAEVLLIAPASAHTIAKCAHGLADDLLTTVCLATQAPILIAPAMNQQMWQHIAVQANIATLQQREIKILGPASGSQACGEFGPGRMLEAQDLLEQLVRHFTKPLLHGKHILITAGPTHEAIDPVRFISNKSSGKMGYALAKAAAQLGATVTLISGPVNIELANASRIKLVHVLTAEEMYQAVLQEISQNTVNIFIGCAAVADYRPSVPQDQKIKKQTDKLLLQLEPTRDILSQVAHMPLEARPFTIGFAAETENLLQNAQYKLQAKNLDMLIANAVDQDKVFGQDENQVVILHRNGERQELPLMSKEALAYEIMQVFAGDPGYKHASACLAGMTAEQ